MDIRKAFDTMRQPFLSKILESFGFDSLFCRWMEAIFNSTRISVLFHGSLRANFACSRGGRNTLSSLLYGIAEEFLIL